MVHSKWPTSREIHEIHDTRQIDHTVELMPDSYYGVSRPMVRRWRDTESPWNGSGVLAHRCCTGTENDMAPGEPVESGPDHEEGIREKRTRIRATWLSNRDCVHLIERALEADVTWALVYGISDNPRKLWDIEHARDVLGYEPQDSAPREIFPGVE